ncbi:nitrite reductase small subunit NirD [Oxalobacteraceae bacterium R-40]|uniref:Nitrite reductase small subunit NirD n=2 Tax=Keguizhuia sedimenti TaxID=3064264 RepID=A0ABU1BL08_9BURK|nr:nitrite reductase small subunit NirD [Oxalobacteraceae bacterium R-40]
MEHHASEAQSWNAVCSIDDILPNTGVCVLVNDRHVAVFHVTDGMPRLFAIDNYDPNSKASVLSRGLVGNLGERIVVASPIYKHHFDLQTGECLEVPESSVHSYQIRIENGNVLIAV